MCAKPTGQTAHAHCISETCLWVTCHNCCISIVLIEIKIFFFYIYFWPVTPTHRNNLLDVLWLFPVCFPWLLPSQPWIYQPMFRPCGIPPPHWIRRPCCQQKLLRSRSRLWLASSLPCWLSHLVSNNLWSKSDKTQQRLKWLMFLEWTSVPQCFPLLFVSYDRSSWIVIVGCFLEKIWTYPMDFM